MSVVRQDNLPAVAGKSASRHSAQEVIDKMAKVHDEYIRRNQISADVQKPRHNTLFEAAKDDCAESIALLASRGEDVNGREHTSEDEPYGHTVLAYAATCNSLMAAAELIKLGADVNAYGYTLPEYRIPMLACASSPESVALLLNHGANMEARGHGGMTSLLYHAGSMNPVGVAMLLKYGADADVCDDQGRTAAELLEKQYTSMLSDVGRKYGWGLSEPTKEHLEEENALENDYRSIRASLEEYSKKPLSAEEMFARGQEWMAGCLHNPTLAEKWFRRAAEQGLFEAQRELVWFYLSGFPPPDAWDTDNSPLAERVPQNYAEAVKWCRRAAEQGDAQMQLEFGHWLEYGSNGVTKDKTEAYVWYSLAAEQGNTEAIIARDRVVEILPPSGLARAKSEIRRRQKTERSGAWFSRLWRK